MADKNWGFKVYCECGTKYYSLNKKDKINCPVCTAEYIPDDLNSRAAIASPVKVEPKKKLDEFDSIDESTEDDSDDIISLDDQKELEDSDEIAKPD